VNKAAIVTGNTIGYVHLMGDTPDISGNTITGCMALSLAHPNVSTAGVSGNTYTCADPTIMISGILNASRLLGSVDGVHTYILNGKLTVTSGATLTIPSGVEVRNNNESYGLRVDGRLDATGVAFTGDYPRLIAYGEMNLSGCTFTTPSIYRSGYVEYAPGSSGTVADCTGDLWDLTLSAPVSVSGITIRYFVVNDSATVTGSTFRQATLNGKAPSMTGNTITAGFPFRISDPDVIQTAFQETPTPTQLPTFSSRVLSTNPEC